jgi:thiamine kinase-like enzyme
LDSRAFLAHTFIADAVEEQHGNASRTLFTLWADEMESDDDIHAERIRSLPFWSGPITLRPLEGGITNRNYLVDDGNERFVARIGEEMHALGVDRRNELQCCRAAESLGVSPPLVYGENGVLVSRYVPSQTLDPAGAREPGFATRIARVLRKLHDGWDVLSGDMLFFSPFQSSRTYVATSRRLGATLPSDIDRLLEAMRKLSHAISPYVPALCHNDLLPANVLDDGQRIWIVDWEYAGMANPLFDLAGFSVNCGYSEDQDVEFLEAYRGEFRQRDLDELRVLKVASLLRDALWAVVQTVASDLDVDYREYARVHFEKFRDSLARLHGDSDDGT